MAPKLLSSAPAWPALTVFNVSAVVLGVVVLGLIVKVVRAGLSPLHKLPGPKPYSLLVGDMPYIMSQPTGSAWKEWAAKYGPTHRTSGGIFDTPGVVTSDLTAIAHIQRNPDLFIKPPKAARMLGRMTGNGVLMAEFHTHRRQRRILNPAFSPAAIREMVPSIFSKAFQLRDRIAAVIEDDAKHDAAPTPPKPEDVVAGARKLDMGKYLTEAAFDIIGLAGCDYDFNCQQTANPIVQGFRDATSGLMRMNFLAILQHFWPVFDIIPTKRLQTVDASLRRTTAVGAELVAQKRRDLTGVEKATETGKDLLTLIVKSNMAHDLPEYQRLSDDEIISQVSTFLLAGSETTSNGLSWILWRLAQNQPVQDRLRQALQTIGTGEPSLDQLDKVPLLENVIRETLRIDSPVPESLREATADTILPLSAPVVGPDGTVFTTIPIPKGEMIILPQGVVHSDKDIWGADADQFNPDRFDRPNCPSTNVPGTYGNLLAFNGGARNCIGYRFALAEMKVVLFVLLQNFKFEILPSKPEITRKNFIVMLPWVVGEEEVGSQMPLLVSNL